MFEPVGREKLGTKLQSFREADLSLHQGYTVAQVVQWRTPPGFSPGVHHSPVSHQSDRHVTFHQAMPATFHPPGVVDAPSNACCGNARMELVSVERGPLIRLPALSLIPRFGLG
eukprot:s6516_g2.t1